MEIHDNILETLGNTPLVRLRRYSPTGAPLAAKVEFFNPGSSVKDRIGIAMLEAAEHDGLLKPGMTIVEPTSGNTGLGLAIAAILKGYKLVCTASSKIPKEKVAMLRAHGARVVICPMEVEPDDPRSYYKVAERIRAVPELASYEVQAWSERDPWISMIPTMNTVRGVLVGIVVFITALGIWNTMMMSVLERTDERERPVIVVAREVLRLASARAQRQQDRQPTGHRPASLFYFATPWRPAAASTAFSSRLTSRCAAHTGDGSPS